MPQAETRTKTLHYKRASIVGGEHQPLSGLLTAAMAREPRPGRRLQRLGDDNSNVRVLNRLYEKGIMVAGMFLDYTEGTHQPTVLLDEDDVELRIDQIPPREREQFIEGLLFFGVQGHHVVLLQSKGLRSAHFEAHLNWLLREHTRLLPMAARLVLVDEPSRQARQKLAGVRSVVLRAPVTLDKLRTDAEDTPKRLGLTSVVSRRISEVLAAEGVFLEQLAADKALAIEDIELSLEIRRRRGSNSSLLDELAHTLRHSDDELFELRTSSGRVLKSGELRLTATRRVRTINGMPVLPDVAHKMHDWLADLIEDRQVSEAV